VNVSDFLAVLKNKKPDDGMDVASILKKNWDFRVEHKGVKIFSSKVIGSDIHSFKGETELSVTFKKLISLFHDMPNYNRWVHQLAEMEVLEKNGIDYVVRQVINTPWPLQKREMIMRTGLAPAGDNSIAVTMTGEPDYLPLNPAYYRVREVTGLWVFTPNGQGKVHLTFVMHLDPGKDVPAAVGNAGMFDVPFHSLNKLRALALDSSYNPPYPPEIEQHLSIVDDVPEKP
jgi:hypothetical protein